ncbi:hypothetical protein ACI65C_004431 [Semiaphis heraclei]
MIAEGTHYIKRRVRSGAVDAHPTEPAIIVNYELDAFVLGENGEPVIGDHKECQKVIHLKSLNSNTDCRALAKEVIHKCNLIHETKLYDVEHLIYYLQTRSTANNKIKEDKNQLGLESSPSNMYHICGLMPEDKASLAKIDEYIEMLYDDMPQKVRGSGFILKVTCDKDNLEELSSSEPTMSALARVLREEYRKSFELSSNIINIFLCFSAYKIFHKMLIDHKICLLCVEVLEYELNRYDKLKSQIVSAPRESKHSKVPTLSKLPVPRSAPITSKIVRSQIPVCASTNSDSRRHSASFENVKQTAKDKTQKSLDTNSIKTGISARSPDELAIHQLRRNLFKLGKNQDQALKGAVELIYNLTIDKTMEEKVVRKGIIKLLCLLLDRTSTDLLLISLKLLIQLSVYKEHIDKMKKYSIVEKLPKMFMMKNPTLENYTIKFLYNLSFDVTLSDEILKVGLLPKITELIGTEESSELVCRLCYHCSMDDRSRALFSHTNCLSKISDLLLTFNQYNLILAALCTNLTLNERNSQLLIAKQGLKPFVQLAIDTSDLMYFKILHNMSSHESLKPQFVELIGQIAHLVTILKDIECIIECVGIIANVNVPEVDFKELLESNNLISWMVQFVNSACKPNQTVTDARLLIEVIKLLGTVSKDENCGELLYEHGTIEQVINLLKNQKGDDELAIQIMYLLYQLMCHPITGDYIIQNTECPIYIIGLMHDPNIRVRKMSNYCLDIIKEFDETWTKKIRAAKFCWFNAYWLNMMKNECDVPSIKPKYDSNNEINLYSYVHQAILMPEDDFMYDKDDNIEIMSTKSHTNSSRPESRNLEDRFDYELDAFNEEQYNINNYDDDIKSTGGHLMQKFTNNIIHFTD